MTRISPTHGRSLLLIGALAVSLWLLGPLGPAAAQQLDRFPILANDIIYDPSSERIYASTPGSAPGSIANSIVIIDPERAVVEAVVFIGSEPGPLAISDDGQFLYVGIAGAAAVRRFHIPSRTPGLQFSLGADPFFGPYVAEDIEVLPGNPNAVAVSLANLGFSPRHAGVAVFDDGVMRMNVTQRHTGSNRIEFAGSSNFLYGYNNESTESGFRRIAVTADGAQEELVVRNLFLSFTWDMEAEDGLIYSTSGDVVDPGTMARIGIFRAIGEVEADAARGLVYFLHDGFGFDTLALNVFNLSTFQPRGSSKLRSVLGSPRSLIRWGKEGLAFHTDDAQLILVSPACRRALNVPIMVCGTGVDRKWRPVRLPSRIADPIVIAGPPSFQDESPGVVRLRKVKSGRFQARFSQWKYLPGRHLPEDVDFLIVGQGRWKVANGSTWEAGTVTVRDSRRWAKKRFTKRFRRPPKVFVTVQSNNGEDPIAARVRKVTRTGFEVSIREEESQLPGLHPMETLGYVAIDSRKGQGTIPDGEDGLDFRLIQTKLDHRFKTVLGKDIKLEEEKSRDRETAHKKERVSVMSIGRGFFAQQAGNRERDTTAIRMR